MKTLATGRILKIALGVVLATTLISPSLAAADPGIGKFAATETPVKEYVLGQLEPEQPLFGFYSASSAGGSGSTVGLAGTMNYTTAVQPKAGGANAVDDFRANPSCSMQCIASGIAYARGPNARLVVKTDTPARIWIHVQGPNGYYRVENSGADEVMQFGFTFDDLQAGTTYDAWAVAKDEHNFVSEAHGEFTTLERNVRISFSRAYLSDWVSGSSKFDSDVWINGDWDSSYSVYDQPLEGDEVSLGIQFIELNDIGRYLDFAVQLYQIPNGCGNSSNASNLYHGEAGCSFLSFAELLEGEKDLDARPAGADSWTEWTLQRTLERPNPGWWPVYNDELLFTVPVTLHVTYTPPF